MLGILIEPNLRSVGLFERTWTLLEIQVLIRGHMESVTPPIIGYTMLVNEEGHRKALTQWKMPFQSKGKAGLITCLGNAVILGDPNVKGQLTGIERPQAEDLLAFLRAEIVWE
ncbi:MAG: hypothetical protein WCQ50_06950 [Spirochaetota bacterium]